MLLNEKPGTKPVWFWIKEESKHEEQVLMQRSQSEPGIWKLGEIILKV